MTDTPPQNLIIKLKSRYGTGKFSFKDCAKGSILYYLQDLLELSGVTVEETVKGLKVTFIELTEDRRKRILSFIESTIHWIEDKD